MNFLVCSRCTQSRTIQIICGLINLTLLCFSYETKFLTSCYSEDNFCQIWAFLSERKSNVFRGQNSLSSAWVSAAVIYWDAWGTVGHNLCEKPMSSPADKDELKYVQAHPDKENHTASCQGSMRCVHRRKREPASSAKEQCPIVRKVTENTLQSSLGLCLW